LLIKAAAKARDIFVFLKANAGKHARKYKPKPEVKNKLTVGEYLTAVRATGKLRPLTFANYENCLHSIFARIFGIKDTDSKYDYRSGGNEKWCER